MLGSQIDDNVANSIVSQLLFLQAQDSEKIFIYTLIHPVGSVTAGLRFMIQFNTLNLMFKQFVSSMAASMGSFLLLATGASKVKNVLRYHIQVMVYPTISEAAHEKRPFHSDR